MTDHAQYLALGGTRGELDRALSKALYAISAAVWALATALDGWHP